ncbi:hypothetical protein [Tabrizicola sp.]|uniref:hypothetical protein n=1 Tax=Tabrizicola sp. TaxID=2005166 RepID=UPI0035AFD2AF
MSKSLLAAGLVLALSPPLAADPATCGWNACPTTISLTSVSAQRSYGLLLAAPEAGCRRVRFRVEGAGVVLGQTPPLDPGELAVVRLGRGFPAGPVRLRIAAIGCDSPPAATRRVTLAKLSPDHGWRAAGD